MRIRREPENPLRAAPGIRIRHAQVIHHTDAELTLTESLVGRVPPFGPRVNRYEG